MASLSCVMSEDQFLCSICLEVFTDPVTTSCGHSFCKTCIDKHWDNSVQYRCPVCKEDFSMRPQIKISTCLSEMVEQFKKKPQNESPERPEIQAVEKGDVCCDVCCETKFKALKSCLACLASYCQSHLEPHLTIPRLQRHQLIKPVENLEDRLCAEHNKTLELFCRDDSEFICLQCISLDHKEHDAVPLKEEGEVEQANVKKMIKEREIQIEEIQKSVDISRKNAEREIEKGIEAFNKLINCVQESLNYLKQDIEEKQKDKEKQATEWIQELEAEILELEKRRSEMEELWCSEDHFHFLQTFISDKPAPVVQDWTEVTVKTPSYEGTVAKAVAKLRDNELDQEIKEVLKDEVLKNELRRVQQFALEVTLDPDTAHPNLVLSYNHKQVHYSDNRKAFSDNPKRFSLCSCVVGKEKFSTGKLYFEVQVEENTGWYIGMVKESSNRTGNIYPRPKNGYWLINLSADGYKVHNNTVYSLHLKSTPKKIGVFVDFNKRIVSFYNVDTAELIYSFTQCSFTEGILPLFNPGRNSNPLVLTPVNV
uniref:E3 ubiquitin-protein ligase TRIM39-like n=1 Tax=Neogobius melanostomus TaxID=47308 RepID=A0A8C6WUR8_9GOBI